jgi:LacI family transcriptional regulator
MDLCHNGSGIVTGINTGIDTGDFEPFPMGHMRAKKRAVTIQDVAKSSGVSVSTVSRVLNAKGDVAFDTKQRIQDVIRQLGYTSNLAARSMRGRKMNLIGLIMPDVAHPFATEVMKGVNRAIAESEYDLLVYTTGDVRKLATAAHEQRFVSLLNNSITDGVVIVAPVASEFATDAPIVSIDPAVVNPAYPSIHATNYQGAMDAMHYLLSLGHTRIGFISGRRELESSIRRMKGYRDALEEAGSGVDEALIGAGDYTTEMAVSCARRLLALENPPTAIFAANDQSAIGVYQVANEMGLKIPEELSVVGFDNVAEAAYLNLTTVDQFIAEMAYRATHRLFSLINGDELDEQIIKMQTQLVIRGSCRRLA